MTKDVHKPVEVSWPDTHLCLPEAHMKNICPGQAKYLHQETDVLATALHVPGQICAWARTHECPCQNWPDQKVAKMQICVFCDHEFGVESIVHFAHCSVTRDFFAQMLLIDQACYAPLDFWGIYDSVLSTVQKIIAALCTHVIYKHFLQIKHGQIKQWTITCW